MTKYQVLTPGMPDTPIRMTQHGHTADDLFSIVSFPTLCFTFVIASIPESPLTTYIFHGSDQFRPSPWSEVSVMKECLRCMG